MKKITSLIAFLVYLGFCPPNASTIISHMDCDSGQSTQQLIDNCTFVFEHILTI